MLEETRAVYIHDTRQLYIFNLFSSFYCVWMENLCFWDEQITRCLFLCTVIVFATLQYKAIKSLMWNINSGVNLELKSREQFEGPHERNRIS